MSMDGQTTIRYLQHYIRQRDCNPDALKDYFFKLTEEVGELALAMRKGAKAADVAHIKGSIDEELWDVIYYALAIANLYDIDVEEVIRAKVKLAEEKYPSGVKFETGR